MVRELGRLELAELASTSRAPGEVVVRLEATGVCHTDLHVMHTGLGIRCPCCSATRAPASSKLSARASGCRSATASCSAGARRAASAVGARAETHAAAARRRARLDGCVANGDKLFQTLQLGTFATRTVVHESAAIGIPDGLPPEQACVIGCAVATGVGSVLETAKVWEGARVAVIGCGAVGLSAVQGARIAGAAEIYALDLDERKLEAARRFGATHIGPGEQLDFVFDVVGRPETVTQGLAMLGHAGTLVYIGLPQPGARAELELNPFFDKRTRILVSHGGDHWPAVDFPRLAQWALDGKLDLAGMVTKTIALDDVRGASRICRAAM